MTKGDLLQVAFFCAFEMQSTVGESNPAKPKPTPSTALTVWRAGLPALGCEAAPKPGDAFYLKQRGGLIRAAAQ
ncbi:hypothetical protein, partial [Pseudomonas syringae]